MADRLKDALDAAGINLSPAEQRAVVELTTQPLNGGWLADVIAKWVTSAYNAGTVSANFAHYVANRPPSADDHLGRTEPGRYCDLCERIEYTVRCPDAL